MRGMAFGMPGANLYSSIPGVFLSSILLIHTPAAQIDWYKHKALNAFFKHPYFNFNTGYSTPAHFLYPKSKIENPILCLVWMNALDYINANVQKKCFYSHTDEKH